MYTSTVLTTPSRDKTRVLARANVRSAGSSYLPRIPPLHLRPEIRVFVRANVITGWVFIFIYTSTVLPLHNIKSTEALIHNTRATWDVCVSPESYPRRQAGSKGQVPPREEVEET